MMSGAVRLGWSSSRVLGGFVGNCHVCRAVAQERPAYLLLPFQSWALGFHASRDGHKVSVNQLEYHPWVPQIHRTAVDWCHRLVFRNHSPQTAVYARLA